MSWAAERANELRLAVALLTRLPTGRLPDPAPGIAAASWAFPLIGLPIGLTLWAVISAATTLGLPLLTATLFGIAATALLTGALHEDGLADTADGLGGGATRERKLEIMRDSRIGSYGVLALILAIGIKTTTLAQIASGPHLLPACLATTALSRLAMTGVLTFLPAARPDGMGAAATGGRGLVPATALTALMILPLALINPTAAALATAAAVAAGLALAALARRQLGGQTGDILGATQQTSEITALVALAAITGT